MLEPDRPDWSAPDASPSPVRSPGAAAQLLQAVLDGLPQPLSVVNAASQLRWWNATGRARLLGSGWTLADGTLSPRRDDQGPFAHALRESCGGARIRLIRVMLADGPAHLALVPIEADEPCALLLPEREALCGPIEMALFGSSTGLTLVEARVLSGLMQGLRPAQIAHEHGVALSTVRTQVAAVLAKTQSTSMVGLLSRVARLPALRAR